MNKTTIKFDERRFVNEVVKVMRKALKKAGQEFVNGLKKNIGEIPKSGAGATGDPEWHKEISKLLTTRFEKHVDGIITQLAGLVDVDDGFLLVKAALMEYGAGSGADTSGGGDGYPIEHVKGVAGLNDSLTGYANPFDADNYLLPANFNQGPQYWFRDMEVFFDWTFNDIIQEAWKEINPWDYIIMK